jgi:hypothetical protein
MVGGQRAEFRLLAVRPDSDGARAVLLVSLGVLNRQVQGATIGDVTSPIRITKISERRSAAIKPFSAIARCREARTGAATASWWGREGEGAVSNRRSTPGNRGLAPRPHPLAAHDALHQQGELWVGVVERQLRQPVRGVDRGVRDLQSGQGQSVRGALGEVEGELLWTTGQRPPPSMVAPVIQACRRSGERGRCSGRSSRRRRAARASACSYGEGRAVGRPWIISPARRRVWALPALLQRRLA